jgi:hypothetical protein
VERPTRAVRRVLAAMAAGAVLRYRTFDAYDLAHLDAVETLMPVGNRVAEEIFRCGFVTTPAARNCAWLMVRHTWSLSDHGRQVLEQSDRRRRRSTASARCEVAA